MHPVSRVLLGVAGVLLIVTLFVPIWRIDLVAPQYPEGLMLLIYANGLGGNVEIINGLNHYIGMQELHTDNFFEFRILPYLLIALAAASVLVALIARKRSLYMLLTAFVLFGIISIADFWRWEYNYGHNLDPKAAIIVPGMAYQPPLIGYKQLLNFGAYSFPDIGGWLMVIAGLLMLGCMFWEKQWIHRIFRLRRSAPVVAVALIAACVDTGPRPIRLNLDNCAFCMMTISDERFGAQTITSKGRVLMFDDISCLIAYQKEYTQVPFAASYIADYLAPHTLISTDAAFLVRGEAVRSPMRGNIAAFSNADSAAVYVGAWQAESVMWNTLIH